jgi:hypothetical protein
MENKKRKFPYWIHIAIGIIWITVGIAFHSNIELVIWIAGGLIMIIIGFLNRIDN